MVWRFVGVPAVVERVTDGAPLSKTMVNSVAAVFRLPAASRATPAAIFTVIGPSAVGSMLNV